VTLWTAQRGRGFAIVSQSSKNLAIARTQGRRSVRNGARECGTVRRGASSPAGMKFKGVFSLVGVAWLERFVPIFDKMGKELSVLLTPSTLHLVMGHTVSGGLELHADLLQEEVFDEYKISSNNSDKIAFKLEPAVLFRVLRGLIGTEATNIEVKLIKRAMGSERSLPFLNFNSKGMVDVVQDVPLAGPLSRREIEDLEAGREWCPSS